VQDLDLPVAAEESGELGRGGLPCGRAGDGVDGLDGGLAGLAVLAMANRVAASSASFALLDNGSLFTHDADWRGAGGEGSDLAMDLTLHSGGQHLAVQRAPRPQPAREPRPLALPVLYRQENADAGGAGRAVGAAALDLNGLSGSAASASRPITPASRHD
jgi:hypothetical protein